MTASVQLVLDRPVRRRIPRPLLTALVRALHRLVRAAAGPGAEVELRVCDDAAMAALHATTFGDRHATDVLSFPAGPELPGSGSARAWLGSIVVNWDAIVRQAPRRDPAGLLREASSLCLHSVAHLLGHDHAGRGEARRMLAVERRIGRRIGLVPQRPYGGSR
jgi:probable rRNA maturation factor